MRVGEGQHRRRTLHSRKHHDECRFPAGIARCLTEYNSATCRWGAGDRTPTRWEMNVPRRHAMSRRFLRGEQRPGRPARRLLRRPRSEGAVAYMFCDARRRWFAHLPSPRGTSNASCCARAGPSRASVLRVCGKAAWGFREAKSRWSVRPRQQCDRTVRAPRQVRHQTRRSRRPRCKAKMQETVFQSRTK